MKSRNPQQMNKVDALVKALLLTYPTLYASRLSALYSLFMSNTYAWRRDGTLEYAPIDDLRETMTFADLDDRLAANERTKAEDTSGTLAVLCATRTAELKRLTTERKLIEADIDLYATNHVMGEQSQSGLDWLKYFTFKYSALAHAPFDTIDMDYALAAEEIALIARNCLWVNLGMVHPHFRRETADAHLLQSYDDLEGFLVRIDAITGRRRTEARMLERTQQILERINHAPTAGPACTSPPPTE